MRHVYVAGPYSTDPGQNVHNATRAATELLDAGLWPYLPHLTHFWNASFPRDYEVWMALDLAWLRKCDALVRLPGHSPGADRELALALEIGIPSYASTREAIDAANGRASGGFVKPGTYVVGERPTCCAPLFAPIYADHIRHMVTLARDRETARRCHYGAAVCTHAQCQGRPPDAPACEPPSPRPPLDP